jgi:hypothetical protein
LKTLANSETIACRLACLSLLCAVHFILNCPASFADQPQSTTDVMSDGTGKKGKQPMADAGALKLTVEMAKISFEYEEPLSLTLTFYNTANRTAALILPMGADASRLFTYEIVETGTKKKWMAYQCSPRSFASDEQRMIAAGGTCHYTESELGIHGEGIIYQSFLPPGHYRLTATYDGQRTFNPDNKTAVCLKSNEVRFSVNPKRL